MASEKDNRKKHNRSGDTKLNWDEDTIHTYQAHQEQALNTNNPNTTTNHAATEEQSDKLENILTGSATTTQEEQPCDNTITNHVESLRRLVQKPQHNTK